MWSHKHFSKRQKSLLIATPGVSIKPDMSKEEQLIESALLKARWELVNSRNWKKRNKDTRTIDLLWQTIIWLCNQLQIYYVLHDYNDPPPNREATSEVSQQPDSDSDWLLALWNARSKQTRSKQAWSISINSVYQILRYILHYRNLAE